MFHPELSTIYVNPWMLAELMKFGNKECDVSDRRPEGNSKGGLLMISCLMPTYNKFPKSQALVEEAIESFYRNAAELDVPAELIICNDTPGQKLEMAEPDPGVRIFNLGERFKTLGDKLNWMTEQARGDYLCRWDDDDLSLPWGLRFRLQTMRDFNLQYLCFSRFYATNGPRTSLETGSFAQCMYTKEAIQAIGGYESSSFGEDQDIERRMIARYGHRARRIKCKLGDTLYLYRWATGSEHLSGFGRGGRGWERIGQNKVVEGDFTLRPHWREDYVQRCKDCLVTRLERDRAKGVPHKDEEHLARFWALKGRPCPEKSASNSSETSPPETT